jgi:hypothetical protein
MRSLRVRTDSHLARQVGPPTADRRASAAPSGRAAARLAAGGSAAPLATAAARVELLEYYLAHHEDLVRCAKASVDWLARYGGVRRSICLAVDPDSSQLVGLAGAGVPGDDVELMS